MMRGALHRLIELCQVKAHWDSSAHVPCEVPAHHPQRSDGCCKHSEHVLNAAQS